MKNCWKIKENKVAPIIYITCAYLINMCTAEGNAFLELDALLLYSRLLYNNGDKIVRLYLDKWDERNMHAANSYNSKELYKSFIK